MELRDALRIARKNRGYTQQQLADLACVGKSTILRLEAGYTARADTLDLIKKVLPEIETAELPKGRKKRGAKQSEPPAEEKKESMPSVTPFWKRLLYARTNRGMSQGHLARLAGMLQQRIWDMEHGAEPTEEERAAIVRILPEIEGGEDPQAKSSALTAALRRETIPAPAPAPVTQREEKTQEEPKIEPRVSVSVDLPEFSAEVSPIVRLTVERDLYKKLYEDLLRRIIK